MALGVEVELFLKLPQHAAKERHLLGRGGKRLAGPQPDMDTNASDLALLAHGHHDKVQRHAPVHGRKAFGLGDQGYRSTLREIVHRADPAALVGRLARYPAQPQSVGGWLVGLRSEERHVGREGDSTWRYQ